MTTSAHSWKRRVSEETSSEQPETRIRRQIDGVEKLLNLKFRSRVLDLGCGSGCQTLELARRKYRVMGMDVTSQALAAAREQARAENLPVHFLNHDMRSMPYESEFSAVVNIRNPVGCFPRERDDLECLKAAGRALKTGGKLFLDLLNREWLIRRLTPVDCADRAGQAFDIRSGRLDCASFRVRGSRADGVGRTMRLYTLTEILDMMPEAGLTFRHVCGGYDGRPYEVESLRMIIIAEKVRKTAAADKHSRDGFERALRIKGRPR